MTEPFDNDPNHDLPLFAPRYTLADIRKSAGCAVRAVQQACPIEQIIHEQDRPRPHDVFGDVSRYEIERYRLDETKLHALITAHAAFEDFHDLCYPAHFESWEQPEFLQQIGYLRTIYPERMPVSENGKPSLKDTDFQWLAGLLFDLAPDLADRYFEMMVMRP